VVLVEIDDRSPGEQLGHSPAEPQLNRGLDTPGQTQDGMAGPRPDGDGSMLDCCMLRGKGII
jgi:hypothetical protein